MGFLTASAIERLPWPLRGLLGCAIGMLAVGFTYAVPGLRALPLLILFCTVVLCGWFFGMAASFGCALVDVALIDVLLTRAQFQFTTGSGNQVVRMGMFLILSTLLGELMRRFADQRVKLKNQELTKSLVLAQAQRQMAEERARTAEALRESDELLQIALRASGMGLWAWDAETNHVMRSEDVYRMIGRTAKTLGEESLRVWLEIVHPEDREMVWNQIMECHDRGGSYRHAYRVFLPDGSMRWLETQGCAQMGSDGRLKRIVGVVADVTQRRNTEEAMLRAEKLAVAGRLAASVAHEINNPLEAVTNLLYLVALAGTLEDAQAHARTAMDELLRVSLIAQSTLKFHRQLGAPRMTHLSEVLDGVITMFRNRLKTAGVELLLETEREIPIACMPGEAQQVFANLISNAVEAMPRGGQLRIRLRAGSDWRDRATQGLRVTVADTGVGMSRATQARIFEPFFTTKAETGTGLGMWVVAQLVTRHSGAVWVRSSTGTGASGTVVSLFLPAESAAPENAAETGNAANTDAMLQH